MEDIDRKPYFNLEISAVRVILLSIILSTLSCDSNSNCLELHIDSDVDSLTHTFFCPIEHPYKIFGFSRLQCNDTIIFNGQKVPPTDTSHQIEPDDYYGSDIVFTYNKYKASEVNIYYKYCFY